MASAEKRLMAWLRDIHAAEKQEETMLSGMVRRLESYPELKARIEQHVAETQRHAERIRGCIKRRGKETSTIKDTGGRMLGMGQALSGLFVGDEVLKGSIACSAFEAMEIASYHILIDTARQLGDEETARACEQNLHEDEDMAKWLDQHLPMLTEQYLAREQTPGARATT